MQTYYVYVYVYMCVYVCIYIYIYIERERESERDIFCVLCFAAPRLPPISGLIDIGPGADLAPSPRNKHLSLLLLLGSSLL